MKRPPRKKKGWAKKSKGAVIGGAVGAGAGATVNKKNRSKGAVIGGVAGGVAGAVIHKRNRALGGVVGAVVGAGGGYAIGRGMDKRDGRY